MADNSESDLQQSFSGERQDDPESRPTSARQPFNLPEDQNSSGFVFPTARPFDRDDSQIRRKIPQFQEEEDDDNDDDDDDDDKEGEEDDEDIDDQGKVVDDSYERDDYHPRVSFAQPDVSLLREASITSSIVRDPFPASTFVRDNSETSTLMRDTSITSNRTMMSRAYSIKSESTTYSVTKDATAYVLHRGKSGLVKKIDSAIAESSESSSDAENVQEDGRQLSKRGSSNSSFSRNMSFLRRKTTETMYANNDYKIHTEDIDIIIYNKNALPIVSQPKKKESALLGLYHRQNTTKLLSLTEYDARNLKKQPPLKLDENISLPILKHEKLFYQRDIISDRDITLVTEYLRQNTSQEDLFTFISIMEKERASVEAKQASSDQLEQQVLLHALNQRLDSARKAL